MHPINHSVYVIVDGMVGHVDGSKFYSMLQFGIFGIVMKHVNYAGEEIEFCKGKHRIKL